LNDRHSSIFPKSRAFGKFLARHRGEAVKITANPVFLWRGCCRHAGFNEADPRQILEDNQANLKGRRVEWELASFLAKYPPEIA
jgi:hypothetical protein